MKPTEKYLAPEIPFYQHLKFYCNREFSSLKVYSWDFPGDQLPPPALLVLWLPFQFLFCGSNFMFMALTPPGLEEGGDPATH